MAGRAAEGFGIAVARSGGGDPLLARREWRARASIVMLMLVCCSASMKSVLGRDVAHGDSIVNSLLFCTRFRVWSKRDHLVVRAVRDDFLDKGGEVLVGHLLGDADRYSRR